jgi:hypothetical protein
MCRRIDCATCQKPSYAGCGRHIESVLGDVPVADRCKCRETAPPKKGWLDFFSKK